MDTIFALSTGMGKAAVSIIRVSGEQCEEILGVLCKRKKWLDRKVVISNIFDSAGRLLDRGLILYFEAPRSFTGEAMIEFQITGGRGIQSALLHALSQFENTRPAEAGEFTRRAFENRKLDLVQVEGLISIVNAETSAQARSSALLAFGGVSKECERARSELLRAASLVEGLLDFSDIEDPDHTTSESVKNALGGARSILYSLLDNARIVERLRDGFAVAFVGRPNVGKSSLINYILKRDAIIVSDLPGTTRDYLEFFVDIGGFPVVIIDTAGFREAADPIERLGVLRSQNRIGSVDLIIWLSEVDESDASYLPMSVPVIKVQAKGDLFSQTSPDLPKFSVSSRTGQGIEALVERIGDHASKFFGNAGLVGVGTERQRAAVSDTVKHIDKALIALSGPEEFVAEDIRAALSALGRVAGRVDVEDILEDVFSRMCVGK